MLYLYTAETSLAQVMKNKMAFQKMIFKGVFSTLPLYFTVFNSGNLHKCLITNRSVFGKHCIFTLKSLFLCCISSVNSLLLEVRSRDILSASCLFSLIFNKWMS